MDIFFGTVGVISFLFGMLTGINWVVFGGLALQIFSIFVLR